MNIKGCGLPLFKRPCYSTVVDWHRHCSASWLVLLASVVASGCDAHDIGRACEPLLEGREPAYRAEGDRRRTETATVVGQDVCLPCDELICVATDGKSGYCSKKCEDDAGCPAGFECRVLITTDPDANPEDKHQFFAGAQFCVWKRCTSEEDCEAPGLLRCREVADSDPASNLKLCDYTETTATKVERPACERTE